MASISDRWHVGGENGERCRTERYGSGKRWQVRYRDPDGASRNRSFERKVDAEHFLTAVSADLLRGEFVDPRAGQMHYSDYAEGWLRRRLVDVSSREAMERRDRCHIRPTWGSVRLSSIKPSAIQDWIGELSENLAASHVRLVFTMFSAVLASAVMDGLIARNPAKAPGIRLPRVPSRRVTPWSADRVRAVIDAHPDQLRLLAALGASVGLRQGEAFGLRIHDVRLDRGEIDVRQQIKLVGGKPTPAAPKYGRTRTVPAPDWLLQEIGDHVDRWSPGAGVRSDSPGVGGLLFVSREGKPLNRNYFNGSVWRPALAKAGVPAGRENGMHALRHFCASTWLEHGVSIKAVSEYLGHADPGFTLRVYTHVMPSADDKARAALASLAP